MWAHVAVVLIVVHSIQGQQQNYDVHQTPADLLDFPGENSELHCKHSVSAFSMISWYQQSVEDSSMTLIAYVRYKTGSVESPFVSYFNISGDGEKYSTLHLVKLSAAEHTAVYYCAASRAQCARSPQPGQQQSYDIQQSPSELLAFPGENTELTIQ
ncbi:T-cell receptor beta chain [Clarias magur]|nr:T-cell receptor beta chain [Clarias magur]